MSQDNIHKENKQVNQIGSFNKSFVSKIGKIVVWIVGLYLSVYFHLHTLYVIVSGIALIFMNLGKRKPGEISAYSVFNKNFTKAAGSMDGDQMIFGHSKTRKSQKIFGQQQQKLAQKIDEFHKNESKYGNKPCYCESGLKFKKCCLIQKRIELQTKPKQI